MICLSISTKNVEEAVRLIEKYGFCELRLDLIKPDYEEMKQLFSKNGKIIATHRDDGSNESMDYLKKAVDLGAWYVDIEFERDSAYKKELIDYASSRGCKVILSYHNFSFTPGFEELKGYIEEEAEKYNPEIVKIACKVIEQRDNITLLSLLNLPYKLVVLGMGEKGKITRITAPFLGSQFTFAGTRQNLTAPGQLDIDTMAEIIEKIREVCP